MCHNTDEPRRLMPTQVDLLSELVTPLPSFTLWLGINPCVLRIFELLVLVLKLQKRSRIN
jgi:hypothetical protein